MPGEIELAHAHRPRCYPQPVEQVPSLLDSSNKPTGLVLNIKKAVNPDVKFTGGIHNGVVKVTVSLAHGELVPSPAMAGFEAYESPLVLPNRRRKRHTHLLCSTLSLTANDSTIKS
jgi:hypothetical protein